MSWPEATEFNGAVQNPLSCFKDPALKNGAAAVNKLGLPIPISGSFATVYKITNGKMRWAVRCFTKEIPDIQERYRLLSQGLKPLKSHLDCLVDFDYQHEGIRVGSNWYPILKMEWVTGTTLRRSIQDRLNDGRRLLKMAEEWRALVEGLKVVGLAHGDLSASNVMVDEFDRLRLVDYDGMFVPALRGKSSREIGHRDFQHPLRNSADYGEHMDDFAAFVIYTSLVTIGHERKFWRENDNDTLMFLSADFKEPYKSETLLKIMQSGNHRLQDLACKLQAACLGTPDQVRDFRDLITESEPWWNQKSSLTEDSKPTFPLLPVEGWYKSSGTERGPKETRKFGAKQPPWWKPEDKGKAEDDA